MAVDKFVDSAQLDNDLTLVANAIRSKAGTVGTIAFPTGFVSAIASISGGGGSGDITGFIEKTLTTCSNSAVSFVGSYTFQSFGNLISIDFQNCKTIFDGAFRSCSSLKNADMPNVEVVKDYAFAYCSALTSIDFSLCNEVGSSAFLGCTSLSSISFPVCKSIDTFAFSSCTSLSSILFPECTSVGWGAFRGCYNLKEASFPECATLDAYCFVGCGLTSINLDKCTSVKWSAFQNCTSLTSVALPACVSMASYVFENCTALTSISLPVCEKFEAMVFYSCTALESISLPYIKALTYSCFYKCSNLSTITIGTGLSQMCNLNSTCFYGTLITSSTGSIYVASSIYQQYVNNSYWSYYFTQLIPISAPAPSVVPTIVSWSTGTDAEVVNMIMAADAGLINLSDYWSVGDTRIVSLSSMTSLITYTGSSYVYETQPSQSVEFTILDFDCIGFSVNEKKPNAIVGIKNCLSLSGNMSWYNTYRSGWTRTERRQWCNRNFFLALPSVFAGAFKRFTWGHATNYSDPTITYCDDFFGLPVEGCMFGYASWGHSEEANLYSQWAYYSISSNRIKGLGLSGCLSSSCFYLGASPTKGSSSFPCGAVTTGGDPGRGSATTAMGLAPFGCI